MSLKKPVVKRHKYTQTEEDWEKMVADAGMDSETFAAAFEAAMNLEDSMPSVDKFKIKPSFDANMSGMLNFVEWSQPEELNLHNWTQEECKQLQDIAALKKFKDWDAIAKVLNTGRTGYQCYVFLRTQAFRCEENAAKWTSNETAVLQSVVDLFKNYKHIPWGQVANSMMTRNKMQCYIKYNMMCEAARRGKYLDEEDCAILSFVSQYGPCFKELSWIMVGRSPAQLSTRYKLLMKLKELSTWSVDDDIKLNYIRQCWPLAEGETFQDVVDTAIEQNIQCFAGRDADSLKERFDLLDSWNANNPAGGDITFAMRRCEWDEIKPKSGNIHFAQALIELNVKLSVELKSYQEAVWKRKGSKKLNKLQSVAKCPLSS